MEARYYRTIYELPLNKFIDCMVEQNLQSLIISGSPTQQELSIAWEGIILDYNDAIGDSETKSYYQLMKEVDRLLIKLKKIEVIIQLLCYRYKKEDADELNELLESNFTFDYEDKIKYKHDLKQAERRSGGVFISYELKRKQFEAIKGKTETGTKPSRDYFENMLITVSDHVKYEIKDTISVSEFCKRVNRYGQYVKLLDSKNGK